jgi:hypothetical protein
MPSSTPNDNGRALEFAVAREFASRGADLTKFASGQLSRYQSYYSALGDKTQSDFVLASRKIADWISSQMIISESTLEMIGDSDPSAANLILRAEASSIKLSLKHNHHALKHQRPYSLAIQSGFSQGSPEDSDHRQRMKDVSDLYRGAASGQTHYNENDTLKMIMLSSICKVCSDSINDWAGRQSGFALDLFRFLVSDDCYQVVVQTGSSVQVEVSDYSTLHAPTAVSARTAAHYLHMKFDNGFELKARLHTASSKISNPGRQLALKFDTQKHAGSVPMFTL